MNLDELREHLSQGELSPADVIRALGTTDLRLGVRIEMPVALAALDDDGQDGSESDSPLSQTVNGAHGALDPVGNYDSLCKLLHEPERRKLRDAYKRELDRYDRVLGLQSPGEGKMRRYRRYDAFGIVLAHALEGLMPLRLPPEVFAWRTGARTGETADDTPLPTVLQAAHAAHTGQRCWLVFGRLPLLALPTWPSSATAIAVLGEQDRRRTRKDLGKTSVPATLVYPADDPENPAVCTHADIAFGPDHVTADVEITAILRVILPLFDVTVAKPEADQTPTTDKRVQLDEAEQALVETVRRATTKKLEVLADGGRIREIAWQSTTLSPRQSQQALQREPHCVQMAAQLDRGLIVGYWQKFVRRFRR